VEGWREQYIGVASLAAPPTTKEKGRKKSMNVGG
jgi:hypothetical protein